jgi:hypothetical protein
VGLPSADFETDRSQISAFLANRDPDLGTSPVEFGGEFAGAMAQITQGIGASVESAGRDWPPSADSSDQGLTDCSVAIGLSNGAGGYGPRGATFAQGFTAYLTGDVGTAYAGGVGGQQAIAGGITLLLRTSVTIPGASGTGQIEATWDADPSTPASAGEVGNLQPGTVLTLLSPPLGSDEQITLLTGPAVPGQNAEAPAALLLRIQAKMQRPPNGGNGTDYQEWMEGATTSTGSPLTQAQLYGYVYPNYYGTGSPLGVILQSGSGTGRKVSAAILTAEAVYIIGSESQEGRSLAAEEATFLTGYMPPERALYGRVRCIPSKSAFNFDWARGATSYTVNSITVAGLPGWATLAGANVVLELNTLAPVSLKDAIGAASEPRIQVDTRSGVAFLGPVVPEQWPCLAYKDAAGKTSLALRVPSVPNFALWVQFGNAVYSGGPIVTPVAANILATVDSPLSGPSRQNGLADRAQLWQDVVGVTTLSTAAENTLDSDDVTKLVARCIAGGVVIGIGPTGTPSAQDVTASDNTINGPEVLYMGRVLVTD